MLKQIYHQLVQPLEAVYGFARLALPTTRYLKYRGVEVDIPQKSLDWLFPKFRNLHDIPEYEEALSNALDEHARSGDRIIVIGGGLGVTVCVAAKHAAPDGHVICYEGNIKNAKRVKTASALNGVSDMVEVHPRIVAKDVGVYSGKKSQAIMPADQIPECDILQMDCEGSETDILKNMNIRPRVIIVETHGFLGAPTENTLESLKCMGYIVENAGLAEPRFGDLCARDDVYCLIGLLDRKEL